MLIRCALVLAAVVGLTCVPADACNPTTSVPASALSYGTCGVASTYVAPATTYYQTQTVLAYPLTLLAVPATTVVTQPAVPAAAPAPVPAPVPAPQPQVQAEAVQPQVNTVVAAPSVVVQRQVYASYAVPALSAIVAPSYCSPVVGAAIGYGTSVVTPGATVIVNRAVRQRTGIFQRLRENRAARATARAGRLQQRATVRRGVPASTVIIR